MGSELTRRDILKAQAAGVAAAAAGIALPAAAQPVPGGVSALEIKWDKAPCRFQAPEGRHTVGVAKDGMKPLAKKVEIVKKTETGLDVRLVEKESYWGAATVWLLLGAGLAGGGIYVSTLDDFVDENGDMKNDRSKFAENAIKSAISDYRKKRAAAGK